jgi:hypothetical protein
VAWCYNTGCQGQTEQGSMVSLFRYYWGPMHYSFQCHGGVDLSSSTRSCDIAGARRTAYQVWSLGCWPFKLPYKGHTTIHTSLQKSDPMFSMGSDQMKPMYNFEVTFPPGRNGFKHPICLLWSKGSFGTQAGPELTEAWGPETMALI